MKATKVFFSAITMLLFLLVHSACQNDADTLRVVNMEAFTPVLAEALLIEARLQSAEAPLRDSIASVLYHTMWKNHGMDEATFYHTLEFYTNESEKALELYEKVLDWLNEREASHLINPMDSL